MKKERTLKYSTEQKKHELQCYALIILQIIGFFVITVYPLLWAIRISFFSYNGIPSETVFVGLDNFKETFFHDAQYWSTWATTLKFTIMKLIVEIPLALIIAVVLNSKIKGKGLYRAIYFMPNLVGVVVVGIIFSNLFSYQGLINAWLAKIGVDAVDWFGKSQFSALAVLALGSVWCSFGVNVLYFIAALSNVSMDMYEAAEIDGASKITQFFKITIPIISPIFATILLLAINGTLHVNEYIIAVTNGAPRGTTFTVMSYITSKFVPGFAEMNADIGYGCAMSFITSIMMCIFAAVYMKIKKKLTDIY